MRVISVICWHKLPQAIDSFNWFKGHLQEKNNNNWCYLVCILGTQCKIKISVDFLYILLSDDMMRSLGIKFKLIWICKLIKMLCAANINTKKTRALQHCGLYNASICMHIVLFALTHRQFSVSSARVSCHCISCSGLWYCQWQQHNINASWAAVLITFTPFANRF